MRTLAAIIALALIAGAAWALPRGGGSSGGGGNSLDFSQATNSGYIAVIK